MEVHVQSVVRWIPDLANISAENAGKKLTEVGDFELAAVLKEGPGDKRSVTYGSRSRCAFWDNAWQHTSRVFGFINNIGSAGPELLTMHQVGNMADASLKSASIKGLEAADCSSNEEVQLEHSGPHALETGNMGRRQERHGPAERSSDGILALSAAELQECDPA